MKNQLYILPLLIVFLLSSCNDDFLNRTPGADLNNETFWTSESSLEIYNNGIYNEAGNNGSYYFLLGYYNSPFASGYNGMGWEDCMSDNGAPKDSRLDKYQVIASGQRVIPDNPTQRGWRWSLLRRINFFLDNYDRTPIAEEVKNKYAAEARLFRAWFYFDKVKHFGDVPWIDKPLNTESDVLYAPRDPRSEVMANVLEDINFAIEHLPENWSSSETRFDKWVALALKSRIALYEGSFQKYRNQGGDAAKWFQEAVSASEVLMNEGPFTLYTTGDPQNDYNHLFRQLELEDISEVIAFRRYITGVNGHRFNGYQRAKANGLTKDLVEDYLAIDGKPIQLSSMYQGDATIEAVFENRDPRLRQTSLHPDDTEKYLLKNDYEAGPYPRFPGMTGGWKTTTGYTMIKYFDVDDFKKGYAKEENDAILFRLGEVLLNFAEAKAELGTLTQADLDKSINLLRDRVGMPHLTLDVELDPKYANEGLPAILVEIRRERRVELAYEGFRYDDLMRWAQGDELTKRVLGMRIDGDIQTQFPGANIVTTEVDGHQYIDVYAGSQFENRVFDPGKDYFFPIAKNVIAQNPAIEQNPGWGE
ncbi:RagB/SusD family nutrient uptake outer membrane protein [Membranicola marinus]|uniref:RagB/SusD family nutrient uptake outer membrane protein n=1 Tax=Membranihabitans marinus TaxID=1227546 RepID=A0A953HKM9_9BACT|nr:RagB/SusD family nutrient uptake outer membrane protein [Membranihabitans marinus]MBY5957639.1 RagB/SusD family nutrient uptake outer membrane protein [Membranihabitans marinus]